MLSEVAELFSETGPLDAKLQRCADEIVAELSLAGAMIWLGDAQGRMRLIASAGLEDADWPEPQVADSVATLLVDRKCYVTQFIQAEVSSPHRDWASSRQMQAYAAYSLRSEEGTRGVLAVYTQDTLSSDTLDTVGLLAGQISMALARWERLEERERLLASERDARLKAEQATRSRDHLLAVVAHDLRNPLSSIVTSTALLKRSPLAEEPGSQKHLQTINSSVERMNRLILDLLDIASIEAGRLSLDLRLQEVASLVQELVDTYGPIAQAKGLRLQIEDESVGRIAGDRVRFQQAIFNLVDNALRFTPPGGTVSVRVLRQGSDVVFAIADAGSGISEADRAHVFEAYWQADARSRSGLGLGLSIAKAIIEAHHGRIWFETAEGRGTTFFVSVPALAERAQSEAHLSA